MGGHILNVKTLNIQKTNIVEKGIGTLLIENQFKAAIKKHLSDVRFDLITYSTPTITFTNVVKYLKKKNLDAISYLQLKAIFPQNAVDIGMFGEKSLFNWFFRTKEKALYKVSDFIGCMSPANVEFVLKHNPEVKADRVSVAGDSRITPFGATLRHYKLDELPGLWDVFIGNMSFVGPRPDVPGYADKLEGADRDVLKLRPGITGPATLKYRLEDEMISEYVAQKQKAGDNRPMQEIAVEYNDTVIYLDKVRLNCYYYRHYSFIKDIKMIFCTVLGKNMEYAVEVI